MGFELCPHCTEDYFPVLIHLGETVDDTATTLGKIIFFSFLLIYVS
jgi:hypothetical protein